MKEKTVDISKLATDEIKARNPRWDAEQVKTLVLLAKHGNPMYEPKAWEREHYKTPHALLVGVLTGK